MAEKKIKRAESSEKKVTHTIKRADSDEVVKPAAEATEEVTEEASAKPAKPVKGKEGALGYRIGAAAAWLVAIAFEVIAVLLFVGKLNWTFASTLTLVIIALVLDLACVITGSLLWKKSNLLDPASNKNKVKFWLWNNMGLIVCAFAFIPFIIIALTNKNADKKTKTVAVIVAVIALLIGGLFSYDWNPISAEEKEEAIEEYSGTDVYWTTFGTVYHLDESCSHLNHSDELTVGTVEQAIEANKTRVCKDCEKRAAKADEKDTDAGIDIDTDTDAEEKGGIVEFNEIVEGESEAAED